MNAMTIKEASTATKDVNEYNYHKECFCSSIAKQILEKLKEEEYKKEFEEWYLKEYGEKYIWKKGWIE